METTQWLDVLTRVPTLTTLNVDICSEMLSSLLVVLQQTTDTGEHVCPMLEELMVVSSVDPSLIQDAVTCFSSTIWQTVRLRRLVLAVQARGPEEFPAGSLEQLRKLMQHVLIQYYAPPPDMSQESSTT